MPDCSLSARQLVRYFERIQNVALATVTAQGEPRVAPIGALLFRGQLYIPTVFTAARTRHIRRRPAVSLSHFVENDLAIIVHGHAQIVMPGDSMFDGVAELHRTFSGQTVLDWGEGVYLEINADVIYTFARHPTNYPE